VIQATSLWDGIEYPGTLAGTPSSKVPFTVKDMALEGQEVIRVKVELDRWGLGTMVESLGELEIINDGSGTRDVGHYRFNLLNAEGETLSVGTVKNHIRSNGVWPLVRDCLNEAEVYQAKPKKPTPSGFTFLDRSLREVAGSCGSSDGGPKKVA
jgi:hypothetical protein